MTPFSVGGSHDKINLMSVCKSCHSKIHAEMETDFIIKVLRGGGVNLYIAKFNTNGSALSLTKIRVQRGY
ncbi:HNH endonuclease [Anaerococcus vaginalis]|uniref:HNH endonuclease n=1 Tax=Anaerococcus vaginalis TaxID=33037 RepID=UPI0022E7EB78|nr:HNH endonuclease [Anaerococcus vaginalis]MDU5086895.1 HNH endonuclease [Anaerococcus vaginalis]MDU5362636.1 HNH endonuclease [Finegoldia magna]MDU5372826.1 HNH endonuclease [Anaerococcus vaginalis]